jgi:hypothetical protein
MGTRGAPRLAGLALPGKRACAAAVVQFESRDLKRPCAALRGSQVGFMPKRSSSKDPNVPAFSNVQQVTDSTQPPFGDVSAALDNAALRNQLMQEMGRIGGLKGGKARAEKLSANTRSEIAKQAALARWKAPKQ